MASPATKRRKLSHSSEDSANDNDSFASFSSDDPSNGDSESNEVPWDSGDMELEGLDNEDEDNGSECAGEQMHVEGESSEEEKAPNKPIVTETRTAPRKVGDLNGTIYNGEVFKSNLFKLQVEELLNQVRPGHTKKNDSVESAVRTLKTIIENIPARKPTPIGEAERSLLKDKVVVPMLLPQGVNYKLEYAKPTHFNVIGSHPLKIGAKHGDDLILDLMVMMPQDLFEKKDYLNHRYFHKRAFYLACLAAGIKSSKEQKYKLSFDYLHGNSLLPILIVEMNKTTHPKHALPCKSFRVVILPSMPEDLFPKEKLLPVKNCVRPKSNSEAEAALLPTSFYNASIRVDSLASSYLKLQNQVLRRCDAYTDACLLGRIWLKQRGFNGRIQGGGFGNFEWSILIALLLEGGGPKGLPAFSSGYSSYQIFKATLQYLAGKDLLKTPHLIGGESTSLPKNAGFPIVFDGARVLNVLFKMTPWSYKLLQYEARATVAMLNDSTFDHFDAALILRTDQPLCRYDVVIELSGTLDVAKTSSGDTDDSVSKTCRTLYSVLSRGLSNRASSISIQLPEDHCWDIASPAFLHAKDSNISIGFMLDPSNAQKLVDHGPSAEDKKAAASFRKFWGEKAELRRFKDGSILESLVWSPKDGTGSIFRQITTYLLKRHFGDKIVPMMNYKGENDSLLLASGSKSQMSDTTLFQPIMAAFQKLERDIRDLEDLPLQVRHILAADAQLSYGSIEVPFVPGRTRMSMPANVVLQFEGSARWPDDLDAIQRTKIAFLLKLAELLDDAVERITTRIGLENSDLPFLNQSFLDIIYGDGPAFRLRIHHDRESTLLERQLQDKTLSSQESLETASALAIYKQSFLRQPAHTQAIQTLSTRFPVLSSTIRLLKKWFSSHLLSTHFSPSFIDLIAARTFTNPYPWMAPSSATTGLLRTLVFLSRWDWRREPWIVDLGATGDMKPEAVSTITTRFEAWRKIDPALNRVVLFAASNVDTDGTTWTDHARPAKVVAARMTALAKAAVSHIKDSGSSLDLSNLFASSLEEYDVLIRLNPKFALKIGQSTKIPNSAFKNLQSTIHIDNEHVGFNPIKLFIADLEKSFGAALVLFYNDDGGDVVAGLWNPQTEERGWKLKLGYSTIPVVKERAGEVFAYLNKEGILNEIARLGGELVKGIEVKQR